MNQERREFVQEQIGFNRGCKDSRSERFFGEPYGKLTRQQQLTIDDMIKEDNE